MILTKISTRIAFYNRLEVGVHGKRRARIAAKAARESRPHCGRMGCECSRFWNLYTGGLDA